VTTHPFEDLFASLTIQAMYDITQTSFAHFVAHVFTSAGYTVEHVANPQFPLGPGLDLNLL